MYGSKVSAQSQPKMVAGALAAILRENRQQKYKQWGQQQLIKLSKL